VGSSFVEIGDDADHVQKEITEGSEQAHRQKSRAGDSRPGCVGARHCQHPADEGARSYRCPSARGGVWTVCHEVDCHPSTPSGMTGETHAGADPGDAASRRKGWKSLESQCAAVPGVADRESGPESGEGICQSPLPTFPASTGSTAESGRRGKSGLRHRTADENPRLPRPATTCATTTRRTPPPGRSSNARRGGNPHRSHRASSSAPQHPVARTRSRGVAAVPISPVPLPRQNFPPARRLGPVAKLRQSAAGHGLRQPANRATPDASRLRPDHGRYPVHGRGQKGIQLLDRSLHPDRRYPHARRGPAVELHRRLHGGLRRRFQAHGYPSGRGGTSSLGIV
jgi:hypothetical protein